MSTINIPDQDLLYIESKLFEIARYQRTVCTDEEYTKFLKLNGIPKVM